VRSGQTQASLRAPCAHPWLVHGRLRYGGSPQGEDAARGSLATPVI
jgi:hypothetical protein